MCRSMSVRRSTEPSTPEFQTGPGPTFNKFQRKKEKKFLEVGQGVMIIHSKEMAVVKYVGHTDFAPGIWVGLELRNPKGNDSDNFDACSTSMFVCFQGSTTARFKDGDISAVRTDTESW